MKTKKPAKQVKKPSKKFPLYKIGKNGDGCLLIVAFMPAEALSRAQAIWRRKKVAVPLNVEICYAGDLDFIPAMKQAHWEA